MGISKKQKAAIDRIFRWYRSHGRTLPWRKTRDPYRILVSEVMLQQTQVDRVIPLYHRFLVHFPTLHDLAKAKTAEVIRAWKGLGYNRRALYVQQVARTIALDPQKTFPRTYAELIELPGIGSYTARAVLSFAFLKPVAVLDTNHRRFYRSFFPHGETVSDHELIERADRLVLGIAECYGKKAVWTWNQAIMDWVALGSLPKEKRQNKRASTAVPFKETNRYLRGRIVDLLRIHGRITRRVVSRSFPATPKERIELVLNGLLRDGLIQERKGHILFPE